MAPGVFSTLVFLLPIVMAIAERRFQGRAVRGSWPGAGGFVLGIVWP